MEAGMGQAAMPACGGADTGAGPHGGLHGADAWHWHRREAYMDARHVCPWCAADDDAPCDGHRRNATLEELIARIRAVLSGGRGPPVHWLGAESPWAFLPGQPPWAPREACQLYNRGGASAAP